MPENHSVEDQQARLLQRIAAEDRSALSEFYDQTAPGLFAYAFRMLGNSQDAEEVIQDVFVQVWKKARTFDPVIGAPFHWAVSITRNRCIDHLRARQRRARTFVELETGTDSLPTANATAEQPGIGEDEQKAVQLALHSLPADQRRAIEMAFFGGLSHQEIAATLNEPLGTIKARIRRGMLKLRETLRAYV